MVGKIIRKSFFKHKGLSVSIFILFLLSVSLLSATLLFFPSSSSNIETLHENANIHDGYLTASPLHVEYIEENVIDEIELKYNVNVEAHFEYNLDVDSKIHRFKVFDENTTTDIPIIYDGTYPLSQGDVFISTLASRSLNVNVGDSLTIENRTYNIVGIGYLSEYTLESSPLDNVLITDISKFQVLYTTQETVDSLNIAPSNITYNYTLDFIDEHTNSEIIDINKEIISAYTNEVEVIGNTSQGTSTVEVFTSGTSYVQDFPASAIDLELKSNGSVMLSLSVVISLIGVVVTVVLFNSVFSTQKREIGIARAEGIYVHELKRWYTFMLSITLITASLAGLFLGSGISTTLSSTYSEFYNIPTTLSVSNTPLQAILYTIAMIVVCIILVYFIAINRKLKTPILSLVKNIDTEKPPKFKFDIIVSKLKFNTKYKLNIMLRNISKVLLLVFAIIVSSFLFLFSAIMINAIGSINSGNITEQFGYESQVITSTFTNEETIESGFYRNVQLVDDESELIISTFNTMNDDIFNITDGRAKVIEKDVYNDGFVISSLVAGDLNLDIGDNIKFINPYTNREIAVEVTQITNSSQNYIAYTSNTYANEIFGDDFFYNTYYTSSSGAENIVANDPYAIRLNVLDFADSMDDSMEIIWTVIGVVSIIASIIAFVVLSIVSSLIISSNKKTISVMKVLGYTDKEIKNIVTSTFKWIIIAVFIISIPLLEVLIQSFIDQATQEMDLYVVVDFGWSYSIFGLIMLLIIYSISSNFAYLSIKKIKLSESLKADE